MGSLSTSDKELIDRLRKVSTFKRKRLLAEANSLDARDAEKRAERLRRLRRAVELWPLSVSESSNLVDEIYAAREIEE